MSVAWEAAQQEASGWKRYLLAGYYLAAGNFSLTVAVVGVVMVGVGAILEPTLSALGFDFGNTPIIAGMLGIWGVTLALLGLIAFALFWVSRMYARASTR